MKTTKTVRQHQNYQNFQNRISFHVVKIETKIVFLQTVSFLYNQAWY